jgi:hypothetical protein
LAIAPFKDLYSASAVNGGSGDQGMSEEVKGREIETYGSISAFAKLFQLLERTGLLVFVHFLWSFGSRWPRWFGFRKEKVTRRD